MIFFIDKFDILPVQPILYRRYTNEFLSWHCDQFTIVEPRKALERELLILKELNHQNILQLSR